MGGTPTLTKPERAQRSRAFSFGEGSERVTTTWLQYTADDGTPFDIIAEHHLGLPTSYPVDPKLHGLSGDYNAFVAAQMGGKQAARDFAMQHNENIPDQHDTERARLRIMRRIEQMVRDEERAVLAS